MIAGAFALSLRRRHLRGPAWTLVGLLAVEVVLGAFIRTQGITAGQTNGIVAPLAVAYAVTAVGVLWAAAWLLGRAMPTAARR